MPAHQLAALPLDELQAYEQYTQQHGLPLWRIEQQLAHIAMLLAAQIAAPGTPLRLSDYLPRPQPPQRSHPSQTPTSAQTDPTEADAQAAADALGFRPPPKRKKQA